MGSALHIKELSPGIRHVLAIVSLCCGNCVVGVDTTMINVALPTIARELHIGTSASVGVISIYQLVLLMTALPFAAFAEKIGLTRLYRIGLLVFLCTSLASGLAQNLPILAAARALQAIGASIILSISPSVVRSLYSPEKLGRGLALNSLVSTASITVAPIVGGLLLSVASWHWIFFASIPLTAVSLALGRFLPAVPAQDRPYDFAAAVMCALMFLLVIGSLQLAANGLPVPIWGTSICLGIALGVVVFRKERRSETAVLPVDLLERPATLAAFAAGLLVYAVFQSTLVNLPFLLQHELGFVPAMVGAVMTAVPFSMMLFVPLAGYLSDRISARTLCVAGMVTCMGGVCALALAPAHGGVFDFGWRLFIFGAGVSIFFPANSRFFLFSAPPQRMAAAGGLMATMRLTGQTIGASIAALILAAGTGMGTTPALVGIALSGAALLCSLFLSSTSRRSATTASA
jgi:DHA2 family multidrug resistance protein-like MFS transporter